MRGRSALIVPVAVAACALALVGLLGSPAETKVKGSGVAERLAFAEPPISGQVRAPAVGEQVGALAPRLERALRVVLPGGDDTASRVELFLLDGESAEVSADISVDVRGREVSVDLPESVEEVMIFHPSYCWERLRPSRSGEQLVELKSCPRLVFQWPVSMSGMARNASGLTFSVRLTPGETWSESQLALAKSLLRETGMWEDVSLARRGASEVWVRRLLLNPPSSRVFEQSLPLPGVAVSTVGYGRFRFGPVGPALESDVLPGDVVEIDLAYPSLYSVRGRVTGLPPDAVSLCLKERGEQGAKVACSIDDNGQFQIHGLSSGEYSLEIAGAVTDRFVRVLPSRRDFEIADESVDLGEAFGAPRPITIYDKVGIRSSEHRHDVSCALVGGDGQLHAGSSLLFKDGRARMLAWEGLSVRLQHRVTLSGFLSADHAIQTVDIPPTTDAVDLELPPAHIVTLTGTSWRRSSRVFIAREGRVLRELFVSEFPEAARDLTLNLPPGRYTLIGCHSPWELRGDPEGEFEAEIIVPDFGDSQPTTLSLNPTPIRIESIRLSGEVDFSEYQLGFMDASGRMCHGLDGAVVGRWAMPAFAALDVVLKSNVDETLTPVAAVSRQREGVTVVDLPLPE